jgi:predicted dehydrogenase
MKIVSEMDGVMLTGVTSRSRANAETAAQLFAGVKAYESVHDMLDDQKLDAVYISVTPGGHGETERELVRRGIPFFSEKPLGIDPGELQDVRSEIKRTGLITSVGYHFRYMDIVAELKELLKQRVAGMAVGYWMGPMPEASWWRAQAQSGGQFVEQTTHLVDIVRFLFGEVAEVYAAYSQTDAAKAKEGVTVADVGAVILKLANGMIVPISNTCLLPMGHSNGLDIYTDQGVLELKQKSLKDIRRGETYVRERVADPYLTENEAFIHAVKTGDTSRILSDYEDGFRSFEVTAAANASAITGLPVKLIR